MSATPRFALPFISPGQAQKEIFHNEALQVLDVVVAAAVETPPLTAPPPMPSVGNCYIVAANPTGEWSSHGHQVAAYTSGGWRFVVPRDGLTAYVKSLGVTAAFRQGAWIIGTLSGSQVTLAGLKVVGARRPAIAAPAAGSTVDVEARSALDEILSALREHGLIEM